MDDVDKQRRTNRRSRVETERDAGLGGRSGVGKGATGGGEAGRKEPGRGLSRRPDP